MSHQDDAQVHADAVAQAHGDDHGEDYDYLENDPFFQSVRERINGKTILDLPTKA